MFILLGRTLERVLPRGRPCLNLYELKRDEASWSELSKELLMSPDIEGIYEGHVDPLFRFVSLAGCISRYLTFTILIVIQCF